MSVCNIACNVVYLNSWDIYPQAYLPTSEYAWGILHRLHGLQLGLATMRRLLLLALEEGEEVESNT